MKKLTLLMGALLVAWAAWGLGPPAVADGGAGEDCAMCHEELVAHFQSNAHARLRTGDWFGNANECASCHGPGDEHMESGDPESIKNFYGGDPDAESETCLSCHASSHGMGAWSVSEHSLAGLSCASCHNPHMGYDVEERQAALGVRARTVGSTAAISEAYFQCFECHTDVQAQMRMPSRHPVLEGQMDCGSCHDVHGANPGLLNVDGRVKDLCVECHPKQQGPFIFQHDPVEEDCSICHRPHGAIADKLLAQTEPFLCLQCHEPHFHVALESPEETEVTLGSIPPNVWDNPNREIGMKQAFLTKCSQCHVSVHGTDNPSQGVTSRGGSLTW
jgi:DmsE family decaheme c-type cytochrome